MAVATAAAGGGANSSHDELVVPVVIPPVRSFDETIPSIEAKSRAQLLKGVTDALSGGSGHGGGGGGGGLPIAVLISVIVDYAMFVGRTTTIGHFPRPLAFCHFQTESGAKQEESGSGSGDSGESGESGVLLVASDFAIFRVDLTRDSRRWAWAGSGDPGIVNGVTALAAKFRSLHAICPDPWPAAPGSGGGGGGYFIADHATVRYCNGKTVSLIAGNDRVQHKAVDGVGEDAAMYQVWDMICTRPQHPSPSQSQSQSSPPSLHRPKMLYIIANNQLRTVDVTTRTVKTLTELSTAEDLTDDSVTAPLALCWDVSSSPPQPSPVTGSGGGGGGGRPARAPFSSLLVVTQSSVWRYDIDSQRRTQAPVPFQSPPHDFFPAAIDCTSGGLLVVCCAEMNSLCVIDPDTGLIEPVCGSYGTPAPPPPPPHPSPPRQPPPPPLTALGRSGDGELAVVEDDGSSGSGVNSLTQARLSFPICVRITQRSQSAVVADRNSMRLIRVTLPPHLFSSFIV